MSNPWYPFYWRDYIADTGHLSLAEHGAYLMLLAHYYMTGAPLPANAEQLHRVCRAFADAERAACNSVLEQFFVLEGDAYHNARADKELAKSRSISEVRSNAAKSRYANAPANAPANAVQLHTQPQPQSQPQSQKQVPPSLENQSFHSKEKQISQTDFDARDLRKLADEYKKLELRLEASVGADSRPTEKEIFEWACLNAGISVERGLEVEERGKKWPQAQRLGVSA
jgi:uncharacterized protein YdaU (DUF1376 family)